MGAVHFSLDAALLRLLRDSLPLAVFVETGTFEGDTVDTARRLFPEVWSVEASEHYFAKAKERFAGVAGVTVVHDGSARFLRERREDFLRRPVLFWLDAHWCCAEGTSGADSQSPLLAELAAIGGLHPQSVLLVDDARLYLCPPPCPHRYQDWPDWDAVTRALLALSPAHRLMVLNDVIILYPAAIRSALAAYAFEQGTDWLGVMNAFRRQQRRRWRWRLFPAG